VRSGRKYNVEFPAVIEGTAMFVDNWLIFPDVLAAAVTRLTTALAPEFTLKL
jgi:hypothetical protein